MRASLCLALLLAVQLALSGVALGAAASHAPLDAFGNPICAAGVDAAGHPASGSHSRLPECCQLGCPMLGGAVLVPPRAGSFDAPRPVAFEARAPLRIQRNAQHDAWRPGNPRAPPSCL